MSYSPPKFTGLPETYSNHYDCSYHVRKEFDFEYAISTATLFLQLR